MSTPNRPKWPKLITSDNDDSDDEKPLSARLPLRTSCDVFSLMPDKDKSNQQTTPSASSATDPIITRVVTKRSVRNPPQVFNPKEFQDNIRKAEAMNLELYKLYENLLLEKTVLEKAKDDAERARLVAQLKLAMVKQQSIEKQKEAAEEAVAAFKAGNEFKEALQGSFNKGWNAARYSVEKHFEFAASKYDKA